MPVSSVIDIHDRQVGDYRRLGGPHEPLTHALLVAERRIVIAVLSPCDPAVTLDEFAPSAGAIGV